MGSFSVVNNIAALTANATLSLTQVSLNNTLARLSSGYRINKSGDDAAGLAVANSYRSSVSVFTQGERNANEGLSKLQIVDSSLNNISLLLDRMATLGAQSASGTFQGNRTTLDQEFQEIKTEITREATQSSVQTGGTFLGAQSVFVGGAATAAVVSFTSAQALDSTGLGLGIANAVGSATITGIDQATAVTNAKAAIATVNNAIGTLGVAQGVYGSAQNRLGYAISLVKSQITNTQAAESVIRDANFASESSNLAKFTILTQSGLAALAQANTSSSGVLALLR